MTIAVDLGRKATKQTKLNLYKGTMAFSIIYFKMTHTRLSKLLWIIFTSDFFISANSVDPDGMPHSSLFVNLKVPVFAKD